MEKIIILQGTTLDEFFNRLEILIDEKIKNNTTELNRTAKAKYLSRREVSAILKISLPTLHEWNKQGLLKSYKIGTKVLYKSNEIEEAINYKSRRFRS